MQYACHHAHSLATAPGFHSDPTSLLSSLGPLGMLGLLFAGVLATLFFLLWTTQQERPAHADTGGFLEGERRWQEGTRPGPHISFAHYDYAPQAQQTSYEQPQPQYPEMPSDEPPPPGKDD